MEEGNLRGVETMLELRDGRKCYPEAVVGVNVGLVFVGSLIAFLAFYQVIILGFWS